jgi:hypothetical protein
VTLLPGRNGLIAWRMAVLSTFREPSLCRHVHRALLRSVLLDVTPIIAATACHQRNYVERYSRYTGMQWKCLPVPTDANGTPAIHYTTVYKVFAKWADDGSLWQAFVASVRHLAAEKQLDLSVLHGDGTNTVAKKGGMASGSRGTNTRRARKSLRSRTTMALS